jgi:hypothetical protein
MARTKHKPRVGYQDGGVVTYDESVPQPRLRPKPRPEAPDDTIYPTTAPDWGDTGADPYQAAMAVGYAGGGDVQPGADMNKRAALLAGLRKRYDAMIAMAQGAHAHGDIKTAAHLASKAHDMVPDGKNLTHNVTPDGHILSVVHGRGGVQSTHAMTSQQFHHYLVGPATSFDHVIDNGVGHNLHIASGKQQPRAPEYPADPIHRVRQVLQHTRKMFGLHQPTQAPQQPQSPTGYAAGGPVRGYDDGGSVDDDTSLPPPDDPGWTAQDERDNPPAPEPPPPERQPLWEQFARQHLGYGAQPDPGTEPSPADAAEAAKPGYQQWAEKYLPTSAVDAAKGAYGNIKQALADYVNGANAAPPADVDRAAQNIANQNPNLSAPEVVQRLIAGPPDPNTSQLPTAEAPAPPAETTAPSTAGSATGYVQPAVDPLTQAISEGRAGVKNAALPATLPAYSTLPPSEPMTPERAAALKTANDRLSDLAQARDLQRQADARNAPAMERRYDPRTGKLTAEVPHYAPARAGGNDAAIQQKAAEAAMKSFTAEQQEFMRNARMKQTNSVPLSKDEQSALDVFNTQYLQHKRLLQTATPTSAPAPTAAAPARAGAQPAGPAAPGKIWIHNATTGQFMQWPP